jgi:flagellar biosynthetic protein FliR
MRDVMTISLEYAPQVCVLVLARVAGVIGGVSFFGRARVPPQIRVCTALVLTLALLPLIPPTWHKAAMALQGNAELIIAMAGEVLLGLVIAFICDLFIGVFLFAGAVAGLSSSLQMAETVDPASGTRNSIIGEILQLLFILLVLLQDGHLVLIRLLYESFTAMPPGATLTATGLWTHLVALGGLMFEWGMCLAAPLVAAALIVDVSMGLMARMAPDFEIMFLSLPVRLGVAFVTLGMMLRYLGPFANRVMERMFAECARVFVG